MKHILHLAVVAGLMAASGGACADGPAPSSFAPPPPSSVPTTAAFMGLGGSYNSVNFGNHHIYAQGVSNVYLNGALVASGQAGGPADAYSDTQSTFAPTAQIGFFRRFAGTNWLWGAKFSYSYLDATSTNQFVNIPQVGAFASANSDSFTGHVIVRSYQTSTDHQLTLMPFIGHAFKRSFIYLGAGPSLTHVQSKLNGVIGFADINGTHTDITGTPANFSSSAWVFGGAATVGATYFLDRSWFLDASYTYAMTARHSSDFSGPFASSTRGYTDTGILSGSYSGRETVQTFAVSINRAF
jgi:opacity protein-like surface antigen